MTEQVPYRPGGNYQRPVTWGPYNPYQATLWQCYTDAYLAHYYGYADTRQPRPGSVIDPARYAAWKAKMVERQQYEVGRSYGAQRALEVADLPEHLWAHLCQRMLDSEPLQAQSLQERGD